MGGIALPTGQVHEQSANTVKNCIHHVRVDITTCITL